MQQVIWGESISFSVWSQSPPGGILSCFVVDSIVLWVCFCFLSSYPSSSCMHACSSLNNTFMWCARDELSCGEVHPQVGLHMQKTMQSVSRCLLCRAIKISSLVVFSLRLRVHGSGGCWLVWSVPVLCVCVCVCQLMTSERHKTRFLWTRRCRCWWGGTSRQKLVSKVQSKRRRAVLTGRRRSCFYSHNRNRKWWRGAAAQEKWKRLWRRYKRIFFSLPLLQSDCRPETFPETSLWCFFTLCGLFMAPEMKVIEKALLPLKALCWS